ncbi:MAG: efflux RND transporter permease subunit, partial [Proteobacteria bacterium]|nr:efflux RND transporter permease subunit [Pseudomonadota bacterium]
MNLIQLLVRQKRLILTTAVLLALAGISAWFNMNRQEDPFFPYRNGFVLTQYPGANVEDVENLVLKPLEQEIAQVEEVKEIMGTARAGFAQVAIEMHEHIYDTDTGWKNIRDAIQRARIKFPQGVLQPVLDDRIIDTPLVVYAISGSNDIMHMRQIAEDIKEKLLAVPELSKVKLYSQVEEEIAIEPYNEILKQLGLNPQYIVAQITDKTQLIALQPLRSDTRQFMLNAQTEFQSIDEIKNTLITLPDGSSLPLTTLANVTYGAIADANSVFWLDGQRAIAIGMFVPVNQLNVVKFGKKIKQLMLEMAKDYPDVEIKPIFFQPDRVSDRISELGNSLLLGMFLVSIVLTLFLGLRPGLVVASIIPLVTFTALAVY